MDLLGVQINAVNEALRMLCLHLVATTQSDVQVIAIGWVTKTDS